MKHALFAAWMLSVLLVGLTAYAMVRHGHLYDYALFCVSTAIMLMLSLATAPLVEETPRCEEERFERTPRVRDCGR